MCYLTNSVVINVSFSFTKLDYNYLESVAFRFPLAARCETNLQSCIWRY